MNRTMKDVRKEFKLFGITIFTTIRTITKVNESDNSVKSIIFTPPRHIKELRSRSKQNSQIEFLEKLYNQDNDDDNLTD